MGGYRKLVGRLLVGVVLGLGLSVLPLPFPGIQITEQAVGATVRLPATQPVAPGDLAEVQAAADEPLDGLRVEATAASVEEFSLMAVVFDEPPREPVMVRVKAPDGSWEDWQELHVAADEGPDDPTNFGTEPFWVQSSDGYEVNLGALDADHAEVVLVRDELRRAVTVTEPLAGASAPFTINTRASWGARAVSGISYGTRIKKGIVHHTVSGNSYTASQVAGIIRGIQAYHIDGRGWTDIGYNFLVDRFGGIWEGRAGGMDRPVVGAHASGWNTNTVGVSVIGDYTSATLNSATRESVAKTLGWKLHTGGTEPAASGQFTSGGGPKYPAGTVVTNPNVLGHGDVGSTACPGSIRDSLGAIRTRAQQWFDSLQSPSPSAGDPDGRFTRAVGGGGNISAAGWASDPDAPGPLTVELLVDGQKVGSTTTTSAGSFSADVKQILSGRRRLCMFVVNRNQGRSSTTHCTDVAVAGADPVGNIEGLNVSGANVGVWGWATDPESADPVPVAMILDNRLIKPAVNARPRPEIAAFLQLRRDTVGWYGTFEGLSAGSHRLCVQAGTIGGGDNAVIGCRNFVVK